MAHSDSGSRVANRGLDPETDPFFGIIRGPDALILSRTSISRPSVEANGTLSRVREFQRRQPGQIRVRWTHVERHKIVVRDLRDQGRRPAFRIVPHPAKFSNLDTDATRRNVRLGDGLRRFADAARTDIIEILRKSASSGILHHESNNLFLKSGPKGDSSRSICYSSWNSRLAVCTSLAARRVRTKTG